MLKKITITLLVMIVIIPKINAQVPKESWMMNFGLKYPRLINHNYKRPHTESFGASMGVQRNFSEHVGLRILLNYNYLHGVYGTPELYGSTHALDLSADFVYYFVPCEPISPYMFIGAAPVAFLLESPPNPLLDEFNLSGQINTGLGFEFNISENLRFKTEFAYTTVFNAGFDGTGIASKGGIFGSDDKSHLSINIGMNYFLEKGDTSKYCQIYDGINVDLQPVDYDKIEEIVKRNIPQEVIKEVVVEKPRSFDEKWILVGVNFEFNSARISPSSYPILYDAAKTLLANPQFKVEIQGYTDNVGTEQYNLLLSQKRAEAVKAYLVSKGVNSVNLNAVGVGEKNPVADNKTAEGRALNRRIEFKIK